MEAYSVTFGGGGSYQTTMEELKRKEEKTVQGT